LLLHFILKRINYQPLNLIDKLESHRLSFFISVEERMGKNLVQKILESHWVDGKLEPHEDIAITIDQTLTQDATGTMAYLQFEALGIPKVRTKLSVSYVDHNMLQIGFENGDDHRFLKSFAAKYGILFSKPGNGICHQVHLERFAKPGETLLGSDSHTPTAGAMGMIAIGAGGLDVAIAMGGAPYYFKMPEVVKVKLKGKLPPWVASKDIMLELLRRLTVKGGVGKVYEFGGEGLTGLSIPERAAIANLGVELGATTILFPCDKRTQDFLKVQGRGRDWIPLRPDPDAEYDDFIEVDLDKLEPLIAQPSSPDNVCPVREVVGEKVHQVCIGSCNNSSYMDLMSVAKILRGNRVHPDLSLAITPGSKQVFEMIAKNGALHDLIHAGARILESACGPCIGMGQAPPTQANSIRTMNRNFPGRSGTPDDQVYLASPYVAAACALKGVITDPRRLGPRSPRILMPKRFLIDDRMILKPSKTPIEVVVERGPNIRSLPIQTPLENMVEGPVLLKVGDNITTDHILPAGAKILPLRSNIPAISKHLFERVDPGFYERAEQSGGGFVVGGENYGQGSSREHAALAPMYLKIRAILAKSYARIHRANLINFGILPLLFKDPEEFQNIQQGDQLKIESLRDRLRVNRTLTVKNVTQGRDFEVHHGLNQREIDILFAGGLLNYTRNHS
jgi:aconitate hydratase